MNSAAYTCEIVCEAVNSRPVGQREAAAALGLQRAATVNLKNSPQALRIELPSYGNEIIMLMKATALASTVSLFDLTGRANIIDAETYVPLEIFVLAGLIYFLFAVFLQSVTR